jgi:uncharacterized protein
LKPIRSIAATLAVGAALLLLPTLLWADVAIPPAPQGRVSDYAGVLSPAQRAALEAQLQRYELLAGSREAPPQGASGERRGAPQIAVVLLPNLDGEPIEDVAIRLAERWKIGSKADDGVLLVLSAAERKLRIEVGYGAEGRLTDALSARMIREFIAPRLHAGDFAGGLRAGVAAIHQALSGEPVTGVDAQAGGGPPPRTPSRGTGWGLSGGFLLLLLLWLLLFSGRGRGGGFLAGMLLGSMFGGRRGDGDGGGGGFSGGGGSFGGGGASGDY